MSFDLVYPDANNPRQGLSNGRNSGSSRSRLAKAAKIEYGGVKTPCIIRDLSVTGAALEISELSGKIPTTFNLIMPDDGLKLPCHVVWRSTFKIGVAFD